MCGISLPIDEMDSMGAFPGGSDESLGQSKEATTLTIIHHCSFQRLHKLWKVLETFQKKDCSVWTKATIDNPTQIKLLSYAYPIQCWPDNLHVYSFWMWKIWCEPEFCPSFTRVNFLANYNSCSWCGSCPWSFFCKLQKMVSQSCRIKCF